jgi:hypothetical protein
VWDLDDPLQRKLDKNSQTSTKKRTKLTVLTSLSVIRVLNTVLLFIVSIETYECIALDRESAHPLESNDVNTTERMKTVIAHTDIVTQALINLELEQHVPGRANLAGVQLNNLPPEKEVYEIVLATPMEREALEMICLKAVHVCEAGLSPEGWAQ